MRSVTAFLMCVSLISVAPAHAGIGSLISKGLSRVTGRGTSKAAQRTASASTKAGARTAGKVGRGIPGTVSRVGGHVTSQAGRTVVTHLGRGGEAALAKLAPSSVPKLAQLSKDLARSPYCDDWLSYIARAGDTALNLAWQNKGGIAVLSVATAMALNPTEFVEAGERVATSAVQSTAEHVASPLMKSMADHAASAIPWSLLGNCVCLVLLGAGVVWYRKRRSPA